MIAGMVFGLEKQHRAMRADFRGDAGSGYAGTDYGDIKLFHFRGATRSRKAKQAPSAVSRTSSTSRKISWADSGPFDGRVIDELVG